MRVSLKNIGGDIAVQAALFSADPAGSQQSA